MTVLTRDTDRAESTTAMKDVATIDAGTKDEKDREDATTVASSNAQETRSPPGSATTTGPNAGVNAPMAAAITAKETGTTSVASSADAIAIAQEATTGLAETTADAGRTEAGSAETTGMSKTDTNPTYR